MQTRFLINNFCLFDFFFCSQKFSVWTSSFSVNSGKVAFDLLFDFKRSYLVVHPISYIKGKRISLKWRHKVFEPSLLYLNSRFVMKNFLFCYSGVVALMPVFLPVWFFPVIVTTSWLEQWFFNDILISNLSRLRNICWQLILETKIIKWNS